jgi:hypothetical protein
VAPPAAADLARLISPEAPYFAGAGSVIVALAVVVAGHRALRRVDDAAPEPAAVEAEAITVGEGA